MKIHLIFMKVTEKIRCYKNNGWSFYCTDEKLYDVILKACAENEAIRRNISTLERRNMNEVGRWQDTMPLGKSEK